MSITTIWSFPLEGFKSYEEVLKFWIHRKIRDRLDNIWEKIQKNTTSEEKWKKYTDIYNFFYVCYAEKEMSMEDISRYLSQTYSVELSARRISYYFQNVFFWKARNPSERITSNVKKKIRQSLLEQENKSFIRNNDIIEARTGFLLAFSDESNRVELDFDHLASFWDETCDRMNYFFRCAWYGDCFFEELTKMNFQEGFWIIRSTKVVNSLARQSWYEMRIEDEHIPQVTQYEMRILQKYLLSVAHSWRVEGIHKYAHIKSVFKNPFITKTLRQYSDTIGIKFPTNIFDYEGKISVEMEWFLEIFFSQDDALKLLLQYMYALYHSKLKWRNTSEDYNRKKSNYSREYHKYFEEVDGFCVFVSALMQLQEAYQLSLISDLWAICEDGILPQLQVLNYGETHIAEEVHEYNIQDKNFQLGLRESSRVFWLPLSSLWDLLIYMGKTDHWHFVSPYPRQEIIEVDDDGIQRRVIYSQSIERESEHVVVDTSKINEMRKMWLKPWIGTVIQGWAQATGKLGSTQDKIFKLIDNTK